MKFSEASEQDFVDAINQHNKRANEHESMVCKLTKELWPDLWNQFLTEPTKYELEVRKQWVLEFPKLRYPARRMNLSKLFEQLGISDDRIAGEPMESLLQVAAVRMDKLRSKPVADSGHNKAESPQSNPLTKRSNAARKRGEWETKALAILKESRDPTTVSDAEIAKRVGVHSSTVGRSKKFTELRRDIEKAFKGSAPKGSKFEGNIEAFDD